MWGENELPKKRIKNGWAESRFGETKVFLGHVNNQEPCNKDYNYDSRVKGNEDYKN